MVSEMLDEWTDGRIKLFITACCLRLRRRLPRVFLEGKYVALETDGERSDHVVALARQLGSQVVIAIVPRLVSRIIPEAQELPLGRETWMSTRGLLPRSVEADEIVNVITGERVHVGPHAGGGEISVAEALKICPVALLRGYGERQEHQEMPDPRP
jgi:(1->4)-alpha-D-glucan 1-alpha-D-glucosylmutase